MKVAKITEAIIQATVVPEGVRKIELRDQEIKGFIVEKTAAGRISFALRSRDPSMNQRCLTIGQHPIMRVAEARARAIQLKAEIQLGADPHQQKRDKKAVPTLKVFVEEQYLPYAKMKKRSHKDDASRLRLHVVSRFGDRKMDSIQRKEIVDMHLELRASGLSAATADRVLSVTKRVYALALEWGAVTINPTAKLSLFLEDNRVENYLNDEQLARLLAVFQTYHNRPVARLFYFGLMTGLRAMEAQTSTWEMVDMLQGTIKIPASSSKSKKARVAPLNSVALSILAEQQPDIAKRSGRIFVTEKGKPILNCQRAWESCRRSAGLPHLRRHDMRHAYGAAMAQAGVSLLQIQACLGHSTPAMSLRYSHVNNQTLQNAAATVAARVNAVSLRLLPPPDATSAPTAS